MDFCHDVSITVRARHTAAEARQWLCPSSSLILTPPTGHLQRLVQDILGPQEHRLRFADEPCTRCRPQCWDQHHVRIPAGCAQRHTVLPQESDQRGIRTLMLPPRSYEELHQTVKPMLEKWIGSPPGTLETTATCARALPLVAQDCDCAPPPQRNTHGCHWPARQSEVSCHSHAASPVSQVRCALLRAWRGAPRPGPAQRCYVLACPPAPLLAPF